VEKEIIKRKSLRIPEYNYSEEGLYFITICTKNRQCILSKIIRDEQNNFIKLELLPFGRIVENNFLKTNKIYNDIKIREYIIMPNHVHFIIEIVKGDMGKNTNPTLLKIPMLISSLKRFINKECKKQIWQRNYYEHIIRNEREHLKILEYIQNNPYKWVYDKYYTKI